MSQETVRQLLDDWDNKESFLQSAPPLVRLPYEDLTRIVSDEQWRPVAASLRFRDCFEFLLRFLGALALSEHFASDPSPSNPNRTPAVDKALADTLLNWTGLSPSTWRALIHRSLGKPTELCRDENDVMGFMLCENLADLFFNGFQLDQRRVSVTKLFAELIEWRNGVVGHGVFSDDDSWEGDLAENLMKLQVCYERFLPFFQDVETCALDVAGKPHVIEGITLLPCEDQLMGIWSEKDDPSEPLEVKIRSLADRSKALSLSPFLALSRCKDCKRISLFSFDRYKSRKKAVEFLENLRNHRFEKRRWSLLKKISDYKSKGEKKQEYISVDKKKLRQKSEKLFAGFSESHIEPTFFVQELHDVIKAQSPKGKYLLVNGQGGVGKSWLARCLPTSFGELSEGSTRAALLTVSNTAAVNWQQAALILHEATFLGLELSHEPFRPMDGAEELLHAGGKGADAVRKGFGDYLASVCAALEESRSIERVVWIIDGLDEWRGAPGEPDILSLLPSALPQRMSIILVARTTGLEESTKSELSRLRESTQESWSEHSYGLGVDYTDVLKEYIGSQHPGIDVSFRSKIVERAGRRFLYVHHYASLVSGRAYRGDAELPPPQNLYREYLGKLKARVGEAFWNEKTLPVLSAFTCALEPISLKALHDLWGIPEEDFLEVYPDLRSFFFRSDREAGGPHKFSLQHQDFRAFAETDKKFARVLRDMNTRFVSTNGNENWDEVTWENEGDRYIIKHLIAHAVRASPATSVI